MWRVNLIQAGSDVMKKVQMWNFRFLGGAIIMGALLSALMVSVDVVPAIGKDNYNRYERDRYEQNRGGYERDRHMRGKRVYRPYGYRERVYRPPPVLYAPAPPPPPPGIGLFFPPLFFNFN